MKGYIALMGFALALFSCKEDSKKKEVQENVASNKETNNTSIIRNNIKLDAKDGLQVKQAFMLRGNGSLVSDSNNVKVGEMVELRLLVDGWKSNKDSIALGASEKIVTNDGTSVVDIPDLFKDEKAVPLSTAQMIRMQITVTKQEKKYDYYMVDFKVWNKESAQSLDGKYKLNIVQ